MICVESNVEAKLALCELLLEVKLERIKPLCLRRVKWVERHTETKVEGVFEAEEVGVAGGSADLHANVVVANWPLADERQVH